MRKFVLIIFVRSIIFELSLRSKGHASVLLEYLCFYRIIIEFGQLSKISRTLINFCSQQGFEFPIVLVLRTKEVKL